MKRSGYDRIEQTAPPHDAASEILEQYVRICLEGTTYHRRKRNICRVFAYLPTVGGFEIANNEIEITRKP